MPTMKWFATLLLAAALLAFPSPRMWQVALAAYAPFPAGCTSTITISQTTSTDLKTFVNNGYICFAKAISSTAQNVSLVQGTGTTCATSTVALDGATTAANGTAVAANGGWVASIPPGSYLKTTTTGQHLCLLQDGGGRLAGFILYMDAP